MAALAEWWIDFGEFLLALLKHFWWLAGAVIGMTTRYWKPVFGHDLPNWLLCFLTSVCLFIQLFLRGGIRSGSYADQRDTI